MMMASKNKCELFCESVRNRLFGRNAEKFGAMAQDALDADAPEIMTPGRLRVNAPLADLRPGECGTISRLMGHTPSRLRLLEMGLTPGTHVKVLRAAAFGGPLDVLARGYQLSLRREEAAQIWLGEE